MEGQVVEEVASGAGEVPQPAVGPGGGELIAVVAAVGAVQLAGFGQELEVVDEVVGAALDEVDLVAGVELEAAQVAAGASSLFDMNHVITCSRLQCSRLLYLVLIQLMLSPWLISISVISPLLW